MALHWDANWVSSDHNIPKYLTLSTNHFNISYSPLVQYYKYSWPPPGQGMYSSTRLSWAAPWQQQLRFRTKFPLSRQTFFFSTRNLHKAFVDGSPCINRLTVHGLSIYLSICISLLALKLRLVRQYLQWLTIERIQTLLTSLRSNVVQ